MTWLVSMLVALLCGLSGLFVGGLIGSLCVSWYQISSREGQSGFFVIFVALGGGLAGLVLGLSAARLVAWMYGPGFVRELLGALAALLLVSGVSALICRVLADIPPTIDGHGLTLEVEFRFPNTFGTETVPTSVGDWQFTLASVVGRTRRAYLDGTIQTDAARHENGQWIVPASVELFTERGSRSVTLAPRDASEVMSFLLPLPARPDASFEQWSVWLPRQQANGESWPADKMSCRFRVLKTPVPSDVVPSR